MGEGCMGILCIILKTFLKKKINLKIKSWKTSGTKLYGKWARSIIASLLDNHPYLGLKIYTDSLEHIQATFKLRSVSLCLLLGFNLVLPHIVFSSKGNREELWNLKTWLKIKGRRGTPGPESRGFHGVKTLLISQEVEKVSKESSDLI